MNRLTIYILASFLCVISCNCFALKRFKYINKLEVKESNIYQILDSVVACRKKCPLYIPENQYIFISKDSITTNYILSVGFQNKVIDLGKNSGCFIYKKHLVIVMHSAINSHLFIWTAKRRKVIYNTYNPNIPPNVDEQDCFIFAYTNNQFTKKFRYCRCDGY